MGNMEEYMKRKREGGMSKAKEDIFKKCRRTVRFPEGERREEREEERKG